MLRNLLGPIRLEPVTPDIGRPFYRAVTTVDALALIEEQRHRWCGGRFEFFAKVGQFPNTAGRPSATPEARRLYSRPVRCVNPKCAPASLSP
jgi:hypothetical protein